MTKFSVESRRTGDRSVVRVQGEVDVTTADLLRSAVFDALGAAPRVEIDLGAASFFDCKGVNVLIGACRHVSFDRDAVVVRHASPPVRRVLCITGVDRLVSLVD